MSGIQGVDKLLPRLNSLVPDFVQAESPEFVAFLKAYFEFLEHETVVLKSQSTIDNLGMEDGSSLLYETATISPSTTAENKILLEQTVESLDNLRRTVASAEGSRQNTDKVILKLQDSLATLTEQTKTEQDLMVKLIESQIDMKPILERISETENSITLKNLQSHLKNIEKYNSQLVQSTTKGQEQMLYDLRNEFKLLAKTLAASMTNIRKKD